MKCVRLHICLCDGLSAGGPCMAFLRGISAEVMMIFTKTLKSAFDVVYTTERDNERLKEGYHVLSPLQ